MKILMVIGTLGRGGAQEQVLLLSRELSRLGHAVGVYVLGPDAPEAAELAASGVDVVVDRKRGRIAPGVLLRLHRHLQRWQPDVVHSFYCDADLYSRLAAWGVPTAVLNSERTDHQAVSLSQRLGYAVTGRLCDGVVANTYAGRAFACRLHALDESRVDVLWNALDLEQVDARLARSPRPAREAFPGEGLKRLCVVASIRPYNDYLLALRTLRCLLDRDPAWRLVCVGSAPAGDAYYAEVLAERDRLALESSVAFLGSRRDVVEVIGSSEVLLVTARAGGFPLAAVEAMASRTLVVGTPYGDLPRVLPSAAQLVPSREPVALAEAVLECFGRREELVHAQRRWVEEHATGAAAAAQVAAIYAKYAGGALSRKGRLPFRRAAVKPATPTECG